MYKFRLNYSISHIDISNNNNSKNTKLVYIDVCYIKLRVLFFVRERLHIRLFQDTPPKNCVSESPAHFWPVIVMIFGKGGAGEFFVIVKTVL